MKEIICNTLQGIAIGDTFGVGLEFVDRDIIKQQVARDTFVNLRTGEYGENYHQGEYSDDTEHTIGVVKAILSGKPLNKDLLLSMWRNEYEQDFLTKGYPRQGHGSIEHRYTGEKSIDEVRQTQAMRLHPGNAPVMRAIPFAFTSPDNHLRYAHLNADATHPHPEAREASLIIIKTAYHLLVDRIHPQHIVSSLYGYVQESTYKKLLQIQGLPQPDELRKEDYEVLCGPQPIPYMASKGYEIKGMPCEALATAYCVIYILLHARTAMDALKRSIQMGGDVDSLAAVTTGILGGLDGLDTLPPFLRQQTEGLDQIKTLGKQLYSTLYG